MASQARPRLQYFLCHALPYILLREAGETENGKPHYGGRAPRLRCSNSQSPISLSTSLF